jgi:HEAT repeat protein
MRLKETVMELLERGDSVGLERMVAAEPRAVQPLQGRLWDPDPDVRRLAARALGAAAAAHPPLGKELLRRAMWALNDEAATNGAPMLPMIGEIGFRAPELVAPFVAPMASYLWDEGLQAGILEALTRISEVAPELVVEVREQLLMIERTGDSGEQASLERLLAVTREGVDGR